MSDSEEYMTAELTYFPPGLDEVELQTIVFGEDPLILLEPLPDGEGFSIKMSMIDPATSAWVLGWISAYLEDTYGLPELEEDEDDA